MLYPNRIPERYLSLDLYACFTVQEEVGLRGAKVAAYHIQPDIGLVVEGTTCSDVPKVEPTGILPEWVMGRLYPLLIWLHTAIKEWSPFDRVCKECRHTLSD